jgi:hypothetical protein
VAVGAGGCVAGSCVAGGCVAGGCGAEVGVADWQATIPTNMAIAITKDNSLNIFVDISFSFYLVCREIAAKLTDFGQAVGSVFLTIVIFSPPFIHFGDFSKNFL